MKKIITITGLPGSGKSSTAKKVAEALGYKHFSSGDLFRKIAKDLGLSIEAMNITAEEQKDIDHEVDALLKKMGDEEEEFVIDSRLAFHWMPEAFKVFLDLDVDTAAERTFKHIKEEGRESETANSVEEVRKSLQVRIDSEHKRYCNLYDIDYTNQKHFDLVVNTGEHTIDDVVKQILDGYKKHLGE